MKTGSFLAAPLYYRGLSKHIDIVQTAHDDLRYCDLFSFKRFAAALSASSQGERDARQTQKREARLMNHRFSKRDASH
jgi:hypothetical protein